MLFIFFLVIFVAKETLATITPNKKRKMKKIHFDLLMILLMLVLILTLNRLDLLEEYAKFGMVPLLAFYWLGQYAERKLKRK